jgi:hypothetical protein
MYIQGNYGQFCGLAFYPFILWAFHRLATDGRRRYLLAAAGGLAGLLLSHNISSMLFAPLLGAYLLYLTVVGEKSGNTGRLTLGLRLASAVALGLGLSAVFWLPAFAERDFIRLTGITTGFFDFRNNFISLDELLAAPRRLDLAAINPWFPLSLGVAHTALVGMLTLGAVVCGLLLRDARGGKASRCSIGLAQGRTRVAAFFALGLLVYAFLTLPQSQPIWEWLPLLELAEFPWRMLGGAILCAAVLVGALVYGAERLVAPRGWQNLAGRGVLGSTLLLIIAAAAPYLFPVQFIPWDTPGPAQVMAYEAQSGAIGTTSTGEFLPRWVDRYPAPGILTTTDREETIASRLDPASLPAGGDTVTLRHVAGETLLRVTSPEPFEATFRVLYWPGWTVWISAEEASALDEVHTWRRVADQTISHPDGLIQARLPAGRYLVRLTLEDTPLRTAGWVFSALSLVVCFALAAPGLWRAPNKGMRRTVAPEPGSGSGSSAPARREANRRYPNVEAVVAAGALIIGLLATRPLGNWMRLQSPPGSVSGVQYSADVTFADQIRLLGYDLPDCTHWLAPVSCSYPTAGGLPEMVIPAGSDVTAVLYWQARRPLDTNYSVFLHLDTVDGRTLAGADEVHPEDIPSSAWPPTLYLRNPLTLKVPDDAQPIRYTLTTGLYERVSGTRLSADQCGGCEALPLAYVWPVTATGPTEDSIPNRLNYRVGDGIELVGYALDAGETLRLTLYWRARTRLTAAYTVFVHARDAHGHMVAQADAPPVEGLYPTDAWRPDQIVADTHTLHPSPDVTSLAVGLYEPLSMRRLPVTDDRGQTVPDGAVIIQVPRAH